MCPTGVNMLSSLLSCSQLFGTVPWNAVPRGIGAWLGHTLSRARIRIRMCYTYDACVRTSTVLGVALRQRKPFPYDRRGRGRRRPRRGWPRGRPHSSSSSLESLQPWGVPGHCLLCYERTCPPADGQTSRGKSKSIIVLNVPCEWEYVYSRWHKATAAAGRKHRSGGMRERAKEQNHLQAK